MVPTAGRAEQEVDQAAEARVGAAVVDPHIDVAAGGHIRDPDGGAVQQRLMSGAQGPGTTGLPSARREPDFWP
ncbi:hypothetical protein GCM10008965_38950 [Methylorubrum aminovorans]|nr:hypothetical protein GCM10025880_23030 [Methylorubrum aminovorans]